MGWVTLSLRKQTLNASINEGEFQDIQLSRKLRATQRHLSYDQSVFNTNKTKELRTAKENYTKIRDERPDVSSDEYEKWKTEYSAAQEDYQAKKQDIEDYYDGVMQDLEDEASEEEQRIQEEQTQIEQQLQAMQAELETVNERIKTDIDRQKINLS